MYCKPQVVCGDPGPVSDRPRRFSPADSTQTYDRTARWLHWLSALVILWAMASGMTIAAVELEPGLKAVITSFNVSLTTCFIPFFVWRLVHALRTPKPVNTAVSARNRRHADIAHWLLYVLVAVVLLSGVLMMEHESHLFGLVTLPNLVSDPAINDFFATVHTQACRLLAILVMVHIAAVIRHHLAGRRVLARML
jgi:cytochrome b561